MRMVVIYIILYIAINAVNYLGIKREKNARLSLKVLKVNP